MPLQKLKFPVLKNKLCNITLLFYYCLNIYFEMIKFYIIIITKLYQPK